MQTTQQIKTSKSLKHSLNQSIISSTKIYSVLSQLGEGSFGSVYLVQDQKGKKYALKRIQTDPFNIEESLKQIEIMKRLSHHNLVKIYDHTLQNDNQSIQIIMQFCQQGDLLNYFKKKNKKIPLRDILKIFKQIVSAFISMNIRRIFHRDLKPQNILLSKGLIVKIADFGCAKSRHNNMEDMSMIDNFTHDKGTAIYASPELLMNQKYSSKCDVWSLGYHPFIGKKVHYTLIKIKELTEDKVIQLDPGTDPTIEKILKLSLIFKDTQRASWRQIWLSRVFCEKINDIKNYIDYLQELMKISYHMTKLFWAARKSFQLTEKKDEVFIYFFIKFQYTSLLQAQQILQRSRQYKYLFTNQAWQLLQADKNFIEQIQATLKDRQKFFQSIKKSLQSKQIFKKIKQKQLKQRISSFFDLDQSIKYGYKILRQVYEQIQNKKVNINGPDIKVWLFLAKWINFQRWYAYQKQPRLQKVLVENTANTNISNDPIKFIKEQLLRYEQGDVVCP